MPVCTSFEKTILEGQLCYQLDVNRLKDDAINTQESLKRVGLSMLIDVNAEYDVRKILGSSDEKIFTDFTDEFIRFEESEKIMIHLDSISNDINTEF